MIKQNTLKEHQRTVSSDDFQDYHNRVMGTFQNILDIIKTEFGIQDEENEFKVFINHGMVNLGRRIS